MVSGLGGSLVSLLPQLRCLVFVACPRCAAPGRALVGSCSWLDRSLQSARLRRARHGLEGKSLSTLIDAEAVAMAALRHPDLPVASLDSASREVKLQSDFRRDLVRQRTQVCNKIRWYLHELDTSVHLPCRALRRCCVVDRLARALDRFDGVVARLARELVARRADLNRHITNLDGEQRSLVRQLAPSVLAVPGCGVLSVDLEPTQGRLP